MIAHDPDLAGLPVEQRLAMAKTRLASYQGQLYEALLNLELLNRTAGSDAQSKELADRITGLRQAIRLHRDEVMALDGATADTPPLAVS